MKIRSRWVTQILAVCAVVSLRLLYATCRVRAIEFEPDTSPYRKRGPDQPERFLYSIWHDVLVMAIFSGKPQNVAGLVSRHQDGSYLADSMKLIGIEPIRGSSKRGGTQALKQCLDAAGKYHIAITPDGPRGPRHVPKEGILFMASITGRRIVPIAAACRRGWRIQGNWTDMLLPLPFSEVYIKAGEPMSVPPGLSREELKGWVELLTERMKLLTQEVEAEYGQAEPLEEKSASETTSKAA